MRLSGVDDAPWESETSEGEPDTGAVESLSKAQNSLCISLSSDQSEESCDIPTPDIERGRNSPHTLCSNNNNNLSSISWNSMYNESSDYKVNEHYQSMDIHSEYLYMENSECTLNYSTNCNWSQCNIDNDIVMNTQTNTHNQDTPEETISTSTYMHNTTHNLMYNFNESSSTNCSKPTYRNKIYYISTYCLMIFYLIIYVIIVIVIVIIITIAHLMISVLIITCF